MWTDGGGEVNGKRIPETVWAAAVHPDPNGAEVSTPVQLSADGECPIPAWTGDGFAVLWGEDTGLRLRRLDRLGGPIGSMVSVKDTGSRVCPTALLATGASLIASWPETEQGVTEKVALLGPDGRATSQVVLASFGPDKAGNVAVDHIGDVVYSAFVDWKNDDAFTTISALDFTLATTSTPTTVPGFMLGFGRAKQSLWLITSTNGKSTAQPSWSDADPRTLENTEPAARPGLPGPGWRVQWAGRSRAQRRQPGGGVE